MSSLTRFGAITLIALAATALLRTLTLFQGTKGVVVAGSLSGFMNVTAGIGGPPIVVYAATTGWPHREYLATMQLYFTGLSILSLAGRGLPDLPPAGFAGVADWGPQWTDWCPYTPPFNFAGLPSISLPLGWSKSGLPIGMMFTAKYADESTLFRLAGQLEKAQPWFDRTPAY